MSSRVIRYATIIVFVLAVAALAVSALLLEQSTHYPERQTAQVSAVATSSQSVLPSYTDTVPESTSTATNDASTTTVATATETKEYPPTPEQEPESAETIGYVTITIPTPYDTPPLPFDELNTATLPAVVNILCGATRASVFSGATGSGIIIDPRGIILTNAHVAQYVLLQAHADAQISCTIRTGSPAQPAYYADIIAFPEQWVRVHARDIHEETQLGTGEDDWALLYITESATTHALPTTFPFVSLDTREGVAQVGQQELLAAYPSGFLDSATLQRNLWPVSSVGQIKNVYTFASSTIDVLSFGGTIVAQGGASGGAALNAWGKLVGILTTSSRGETTEERDLRAVSLAHINRSFAAHTGMSLKDFLDQGNFNERAASFAQEVMPTLLLYYGQ